MRGLILPRALKIHTAIEEEIFYPATRDVLPKSEDMLDEAKVEHDSAKELIEQIEAGKPGDVSAVSGGGYAAFWYYSRLSELLSAMAALRLSLFRPAGYSLSEPVRSGAGHAQAPMPNQRRCG